MEKSDAIKRKALRMIEAGETIAGAAERLGVSRQSVHTWIRAQRALEAEREKAPGVKKKAKAKPAAAAPNPGRPLAPGASDSIWSELERGATDAVKYALTVLRDKRAAPQTRMRAAETILDRSGYTRQRAEARARAAAAEAPEKVAARDWSALSDEDWAALDAILLKAAGPLQ